MLDISIDNVAEHLIDFSLAFTCSELGNHILLVLD